MRPRCRREPGQGRNRRVFTRMGWGLLIALVAAGPALAVVVPERAGVGEKIARHPDLDITNAFQSPSQLPPQAAARAVAALAALGVPADRGRVDLRGGRFATVLATQPMVPGSGVGNELAWDDLGGPPADDAALGRAAWQAFRGYLHAHGASLDIDVGELAASPRVTVQRGGALIQVYAPRVIDGVPVRDSFVAATLNHGNAVLFGAHNWGDVDVATVPDLDADAALAAVQAHVDPFTIAGAWGKSELNLVPMAKGRDLSRVPVGQGYTYRLVWVLRPSFQGDLGRYEALVDAHSGELIAFDDTNRYATTRQVQGGVYPESNDGSGPEGVEQAGWPMPFVDVVNAGTTYTTDAGGNLLNCVDGTITSQLRGTYMLMNDNCGAISLSGAGDLDFGTSGGIDCTTPGIGGAGNTHASRSGFYEMNRIKEMARGQLPGNAWLQQQLQANMNINNTCNAFWGGGTVNFYRAGGGCNNTGELAGVFDHEWGHGLDDNDATPGISNPGEGIPDVYAALRLGTSCIGRGFRLGTACGGYGDPCVGSPPCDGVRDIDWANHLSGTPHTFTWANASCGGSSHCRGYVYSEAVWDLWNRDLPANFGMDNDTALEVTTRMTFLGAGGVSTWYSGSPPFGGCAATSGYQQYLAADDDNGNVNDGTPHMAAIYAAFNRHEIACSTPTVQTSGCAGTPTAAPSVTATAVDRGAQLSWGAVAGASEYEIFRTDGVFACDFGKTRVGATTGTSFVDSGLQNGRDYSYTVIAKGPAGSCFGPASACTTVTPAAGANLQLDTASAALAIAGGDGDDFLDNCETGTFSFDVVNVGAGSATNARIVDVRPVSHPSIVINTALPAAVSPSTLANCATGTGGFSFTAGGLAFGDTVTFEVDVTSDELFPIVKTATLTVGNAESDLQFMASRTWDFESDLEGWTLVQGTFNRASAGGGAGGSAWYTRSSSLLNNQCDQIRSPAFRLTATSTMSTSTNFDIENFSGGSWWDRANFAVLDGGVRSAKSPDSGRLYNASGAGATCVTVGQPGWAASSPTWATSGWSAAALGSAGLAGKTIQLDVAYGTDVSVVGDGFRFDRVTVTDVEFLVADGQSDTCTPECATDPDCDDGLYCNGAETCVSGTCQPGTAPSCDDGVGCTDDSCNEATDSCDHVASDANCDDGLFCNGAETCSATLDCQAGTDPCQPGETCDEVNDVCLPPGACDNDGICEAGEDCNNCPNDCISGTVPGASCGNGICESGNGENCVNCAADCNGQTSGKPANRFCCGTGDSYSPDGCGDSRCVTGGFQCTTTPANPVDYCCGDAICNGAENSANCSLDCGAPPVCGDSICNGSETQCTCALDCGTPPANEIPNSTCQDGIDNDCGGGIDCADADCASDPACVVCVPKGGACTQNSQCCSGTCKGNGTCR